MAGACVVCGSGLSGRQRKYCSVVCRSGGGLVGAVDLSVSALATGPEHRAVVVACRMLAVRVDADEDAGVFDDKLWREFRLALAALREAVTSDGVDPIGELIDELRG